MKKLYILCLLIPFLSLSQTQIGQDIDGDAFFDSFGWSISLSSDGSIVAIGAPTNDSNGNMSGHVKIYENVNEVWTQIGDDIEGESYLNESGHSISLSSDGSIVAIGARTNNGVNGNLSGHVRVFENINDVWTQIGSDIDGDFAGGYFGEAVSLSSDGSILAVASISGSVRVFNNQSNNWVQVGQNINNAGNISSIGDISLSSDGSIVAIGAFGNDTSFGEDSGVTLIYENISGVWTQIGNDIDGEAEDDWSGFDVSLSSDGSVVAIGAIFNIGTNGVRSGHVRVYENIGGTWTQIGDDIDGEDSADSSGYSVSLSSDGSIVAIGAPLNNPNIVIADIGQVRIYKNTGGVWTQLGQDIIGEGAQDESGRSVCLSSDGSIVAIGAPFNAVGNTPGSAYGHVRVYDLSAVLSSDDFVQSQFSLYPNPATNQFTIKLNESLELEHINIYNHLGQLITSTQETIVNTSEFATGLYNIEVITNKGKTSKKLIIE